MTADSNKILAGIGPASLAYFAPGDTVGPVGVVFTAETQTVTITGAPTGGAFTLTWNGYSSGSQVYNVTTSALQTALRVAWKMAALTVTGTAGTSYVIVFDANYGNVPLITALGAFTGGTTPTIGVVETTPGAGSTPASAAIPITFLDAGWVDTSGLTAKVAESSNTVKGYGTTSPLRIIISESARSFDLTFLETNPVSLAVYNRLALASVVPTTAGNLTITVGGPLTQTYAGIFDVVDGNNHIRVIAPRLQVVTIKDRTVTPGKEISYGVTMQAIPDANGNAVYEYYTVNALAS